MIVAAALVVLVGVAAVSVALRLAVGDGAAKVLVGLTLVIGLALVLVGVMGGIGVDRGSDDDPQPEASAVDRAPTRGPAPLQAPTVRLVATSADALPPVPSAVGDLEAGSVLVVGLLGLDAGSTATIHQCRAGALAATDCRPGLPVTVDDHQRAMVAVDLEARFGIGRAGEEVADCRREECSVVVFGTSRLEVVTVFDRPAPPPPRVGADPVTLPPGGTLTATADGLPPAARAAFVVCRPGGDGDADCGPPTDAVLVDDDGRAAAPVTINPGRCPRGTTCAVAVVLGDGGPRAFAHLHLIGRSGATFDDTRLAVGLAIAGLLLVAALILLRTTDWTPAGGDPFAGVVIPEDPFADVPDP